VKILMLAPDSQMIDRRIVQEAHALQQAGHAVTVVAGFDCEREQHFDLAGVAVHRFATAAARPTGNDRPRLPRLRAIASRLWIAWQRARGDGLLPEERRMVELAGAFAADAVHCHDLPVLRAGAVLAARWRVPLLYDAHEIYHAQVSLPAALRTRLLRDERQLAPRCEAIVTVNDFLADALQRLHGGARPIVVHNSVDPSTVPARGAGRLRASLPGAGPLLLFQGWLGRERNLDVMVRATALLPPPVRLAIVGYGEHEPVLRTLAKELHVADRVHFLGAVPSHELPAYTIEADLGLIPYLPIDLNHRLCSPNKFFEFVAAGVPVVAHDLPFFRAMAERHGVVQLADMADAGAIASAITAALAPANLDRLRANCPRAADALAWRHDAARLLAIYARLS